MKENGQEETKTDWKLVATTLTYFIENLAKLMAPKMVAKFSRRVVTSAEKMHQHLTHLRNLVRAIRTDGFLDEGIEIRSVATLYETQSVIPPASYEEHPLDFAYNAALDADPDREDKIRSVMAHYKIDEDVYAGSLGVRYLIGGLRYQLVCNTGDLDYYLQRCEEGIYDLATHLADTSADVELAEKYMRGEIKSRLQSVIAELQGEKLLLLLVQISSLLAILPWVNNGALKRNCLSLWNALHSAPDEFGSFNHPAYVNFSTDEVNAQALVLPTCRGDPTGQLKGALLGKYDPAVPFELFEHRDPTFTSADLAWLERMTRHSEFDTEDDMHRKVIDVNDNVVIYPSPMLATGLSTNVFDYSREGFSPRDMASAFLSFSPHIDDGVTFRLYVVSETMAPSHTSMEFNSRTVNVYPDDNMGHSMIAEQIPIESALQRELAYAFRSILRDIYDPLLERLPDADEALDEFVKAFIGHTADLYLAYIDGQSTELYSHVAQSFSLHIDSSTKVEVESDGTTFEHKVMGACVPHGIIRTNPSQSAEFIESVIYDLDAPDSLPQEIIASLCVETSTDIALHNFEASSWTDMLEIPHLGPSKHFIRIYHEAKYFNRTDFPRASIISTGGLGLVTNEPVLEDWVDRSDSSSRPDSAFAIVATNPPRDVIWDHHSVSLTRERDMDAESYILGVGPRPDHDEEE